MSRIARIAAAALFFGVALAGATPASAEVRFGPNVRVGGHRIAPHSARWVKIRTVRNYNGPYGCRVYPRGARVDGVWRAGPIRKCAFKSIPPSQRR